MLFLAYSLSLEGSKKEKRAQLLLKFSLFNENIFKKTRPVRHVFSFAERKEGFQEDDKCDILQFGVRQIALRHGQIAYIPPVRLKHS